VKILNGVRGRRETVRKNEREGEIAPKQKKPQKRKKIEKKERDPESLGTQR